MGLPETEVQVGPEWPRFTSIGNSSVVDKAGMCRANPRVRRTHRGPPWGVAGLRSLAHAVVECAGTGVCTSGYDLLAFQHVRRPIYPLDTL